MVQKEQVCIAEDLIEHKIRPLINRVSLTCKDCECSYGDAECVGTQNCGCLYYAVLTTLQQTEAFLGSNLIDAKLKNGR